MDATKAYNLYRGIKFHFNNEKYDFFFYQGKLTRVKNISEAEYKKFQKLGQRYNDELINFYVANILEDPKVAVYQLITQEADEIFTSWKAKNQSLTFRVINDMIDYVGNNNFRDLFNKKDPKILKMALRSEIMFETLVIMDNYLKFTEKWKQCNDNILYHDINMKSKKYFPFLSFDSKKIKKTLIEILKNEEVSS